MTWIDLTPELTKLGQRELKVGQVLMFNKDGEENNFKITRKYKGKVWARPIILYREDEIQVVDKLE